MVIATIAAVVFAVAWAVQKLANEALVHMMLTKGMDVNEDEFKRHVRECIARRFKRGG